MFLCFSRPSQPRKLSDNLVQHFSLPDETPPILEAEMTLRAEQLVNGERGQHAALTERKIISPDQHHQKTDWKPTDERELSPATENIRDTSRIQPEVKEVKREEVKGRQEVHALKQEMKEERQEPEGGLTVTPVRDEPRAPVVCRNHRTIKLY